MCSCRGGTRGGSSRPPVERSTSSPSPEVHHPHALGEGRHPNSRRGRGWAHSSGDVFDEFAVHSDNSPPPLHPAPLSAHFRFCSSLNRAIITASISISFSKETTLSTSQVNISTSSQEGSLRGNNCKGSGNNVMVDSLLTSPGPNLGGTLHGEGGGSTVTHPLGCSCYNDFAIQDASGNKSEPDSGGGGLQGSASIDMVDDLAFPIIEESILKNDN